MAAVRCCEACCDWEHRDCRRRWQGRLRCPPRVTAAGDGPGLVFPGREVVILADRGDGQPRWGERSQSCVVVRGEAFMGGVRYRAGEAQATGEKV